MYQTSKGHEKKVLSSIFSDSKDFFEKMGYIGYEYKGNDGNGVPDGVFQKGASKIWVEHTQARLNYGNKGSRLPGLDGFCKDVQHELLKEGYKGCMCFDISYLIADKYLSSPEFKAEILNMARSAIGSSAEFVDEGRRIFVKYCPTEKCCLQSLNDYKGLRVTPSQWHNIEFCQTIPLALYDECVRVKEGKYQKNTDERNENWLFIEIPWGYTFEEDLPEKSVYFDRIFLVEQSCKDGREIFQPRLSATK